MLEAPFTFDDIMAPLGAERFLAEYEDRQPLHLKGAADKFAQVMTWARLNELLGMITIWSKHSLMLVLDDEPIPAQRYCAPALGRDGGQVMRPDPDRVKDFLRRGATLVANDIDHLGPGLIAFADAMDQALHGRVQANLYLSSRRRPGFGAHFDTHDVYAIQVEGTKTWHVYEGRADHPIAHPQFKNYGRAHHEQAKGELAMEVHMAPGDLLYLPRGQYHDALADEGGTVHIAFGISYPLGLDVVSWLFERVVGEPAFRTNLPRPGTPGAERALAGHLRSLGDQVGAVLAAPETLAQIRSFQDGFRYPRHGYDLPKLLAEPADERFRVRGKGVRLVRHQGRAGLVRDGSREAIEVPAELASMVAWVLERPVFARADLATAFPGAAPALVDRLLRDLAGMRLTEPA